MQERKAPNLRNVLSFAAITLTLLAATAAVSLVLATSVLQKMTAEIAASVESVRAIEEAEVALLRHLHAVDRGEQSNYAEQFREQIGIAARNVTSDSEMTMLKQATREVDRYFTISSAPTTSVTEIRDQEREAVDALERLVDLDVAQAEAARLRAIHWDRISSVAGIVLGVSIVSITVVLVLWLRRRVIRPLFSLADTMKRFGEGDRTTRAEAQGPTELREMTMRFNDMADSIAAQRQAQTAFLAGVAHDLRNPLSALKLAVELVVPTEPLPPERQLRGTLAMIGRQIDQLERMVSDFLDMEKIEAGELHLTIAEHDVRSLVTGAVELFEPTAQNRMSIAMPEDPIVVPCDAVRISQALTNLVSNAIKYSPPAEPIDIVVARNAEQVTIAVTDRGVGIPRDDYERIFEPFRRGATRNTVPGTGLGLYNVQRIVRAHAGRIEVDSVPAVGSTFRIWLPSARSYSDQQSTPAQTAAAM